MAVMALFGAIAILLAAAAGVVWLCLRFLLLRRTTRVLERTVRQQAQSLLAAFFLEDLLLPHDRPE